MGSDLQSAFFILKDFYVIKQVEEAVYSKGALLGMIEKDERFEGKNLPIPIVTGRPQGNSQNFLAAQKAAAVTSSGTIGSEFFLQQTLEYSLQQITNQVIQNTKSDMGAFMRYLKDTIRFQLDQFAYRLSWKVFDDGFSVMSRVGTVTNVGALYTITLSNIFDIYKFAANQIITTTTTKSGPPGPTNELIVNTVNFGTGVITATLTTGTGPAATDYIFTLGDYSPTLNVPSGVLGLSAWIPDVAPVSGDPAFLGVDRSINPTALAGTRYNANGSPIEEAVLDLVTSVATNGFGIPTHVFMNPYRLSELVKSLQTRRAYVQIDEKGKLKEGQVFFKSVLVQTPYGDVRVLQDRNCPYSKYYALKMDDWTLYSNGGAPRVFDTDGMDMLRMPTADAIEFRAYGYMQNACHNPGSSGVGFF